VPSESPVSRKSGTALRAFLVPAVRPTDLARRAGVSAQYVYAVLDGKRPPSARIIKAAAELGLPVDDIFGQSPEKRVPGLAGQQGTRRLRNDKPTPPA
jgi:transcriptional regulator with XRE-family HTH domain